MLPALNWTNSAPARDEERFLTTLNRIEERLAYQLAHSFEHRHPVSVVDIRRALNGGSLASVIELVPEVANFYGRLTEHQMKTIVMVDSQIAYKTPSRRGRCRIKSAGRPSPSLFPHICFANDEEFDKVVSFGTSTLLIVFQPGGLLGRSPARMLSLARALSTQRIESILVITTDSTPQMELQFAYNFFRRYRQTIGYSEM